jgi:hypothetical protein
VAAKSKAQAPNTTNTIMLNVVDAIACAASWSIDLTSATGASL